MSIAITVVSLVAFSTLVYSVYQDYTVVASNVSGGIRENVAVQGSAATVNFNVTIPNGGLYMLVVGLSCAPGNGSVSITCNNAVVTVPPGTTQTLRFVMVVSNVTQATLSDLQVQGTLSLTLQPFATMSLSLNLAQFGGEGA